LYQSFPLASLEILWEHLLKLALLAIAREQQQSARQPFHGGVKELID
jgi:hypothetical protein